MDLVELVKATYLVIGQDLNDLALKTIVKELQGHPEQDVAHALERCRKELKRIALVDILDRIPGQHPGPEEAWAPLARVWSDENWPLVWTEEMKAGYNACHGLDVVQARLVFKEVYIKEVAEARAHGRRPVWSVAAACGRDGAVKTAEAIQQYARKNLITKQEEQRLLDTYCGEVYAKKPARTGFTHIGDLIDDALGLIGKEPPKQKRIGS
jgi:hypothetical protein